ncbi:porin family protein [Devosia sp. A16]|uniref:porin family protein n=1 Tax=Devosia sp. A16 TaxID=1736675 RepID=UPI0006D78DCD|nr:porin family protein [Devosia sp. A16]
MNKLILTAAAFALLAATPAFAADPIVSDAVADFGGFYAEVYGGVALPSIATWNGDDYDLKVGPAFGASFGVATPVPGLSVGLDVMWTSAEYAEAVYSNEFQHSLSGMVEVEYAVPLNDTFELYGAAGLGFVGITYEDANGDKLSDAGAGYQVAIGARANVLENVALFGEFKHQDTFDTVALGTNDVSSPTNTLLVGLRFAM